MLSHSNIVVHEQSQQHLDHCDHTVNHRCATAAAEAHAITCCADQRACMQWCTANACMTHCRGVMRTTQCLRIMKIDTARDILYVKGHVPGNRGCFVRVKDAVRRCEFPQPPPFPAFVPQEGAEYPLELVADVGETDPMSG
jgi:hypothetical protein